MTTRFRRVSISVLATFLAISMFPAYAFAASVVQSETGPVSEVSVAGNNYAAYTTIQLHSDLYMNGYSNILGNVRTPAGGFKATSYMYWVNDIQEPWLMATSSSTNSDSVAPGFAWTNQVWAKYSLTSAYRCQSSHWINYSGGSHGFGTQAQLFWSTGWPLPFSGDAESSLTELVTPVDTNGSGLTYGPSQNLSDPEGQPDLVGVVATNGELGYVYYEDLYAATVGDLPSMDPEEAVSRNDERNARMAAAFKEAADELYGAEVLTEQDALAGLELLHDQEGIGGAVELINQRIDGASGGRGDINPISEHEFRVLYDSAMSKVSSFIPVYESDGSTVKGEFAVGPK